MDTIYIRELRLETTIGIATWEQRIKQTIILDLELGTDIRKSAESQQITDTVDYQQVARCLQEHIDTQKFLLIETLAEQVAKWVLEKFPITWLKLRLSKPGVIANAKDVGIIIERHARHQPAIPDPSHNSPVQ